MFDSYFKKTYKDCIDEQINYYIHRDDYETSITNLHIENKSELTMIVYATVYVNYYAYQDNEDKKCLTVKCYVDLDNKNNFKVLEIVEYEKSVIGSYYLNSKTLLPYISSDKYEKIAGEILNKYFTKEELKNYIDPKELAKRMGLRIQYHRLSSDKSIFGLTCFKDCYINLYDGGQEEKKYINKGTVIVDREAQSEYGGFSSKNFTITHECVHWYLHRKYFFLEKEILNYVSCGNEGIPSSIDAYKEDFAQMEYQANGIAARIILPFNLIKRDFDSLYDSFILTNNKIRTYEKCIDNISKKSSASRDAVKTRLKEIGYKVEGIFEYVDGRYLKSYLHEMKLNYDESYSLSEFDLLKLIMMNDEFRKYSANNNYLFIDNHLCFNDEKYITNDYQLTDYALDHIDECCILFKYKSLKNNKKIITNKCLLFRANSKGRDFYIDAFNPPVIITPNKGVSFIEEYKKIQNLLARIHNMDIHSALKECRESLRISQKELALKCNYSEQTIKEIENKSIRGVSIKNIIRLSIGMRLPKEITYKLLEIGNHSLDNEMSQESAIYRYIIEYMSNYSIEDIDMLLINYNQEPLFYERTAYK